MWKIKGAELDIDKVLLWDQIDDNRLIIYNLGKMNEWKATDEYIKEPDEIYHYYLNENRYAAPVDKFIKRYNLDQSWIAYPYGYFPQEFFNILTNKPMDLERLLKTLDMRIRRKGKEVVIINVIAYVTLPNRIQVFVDFGNKDKAIIDILRILELDSGLVIF